MLTAHVITLITPEPSPLCAAMAERIAQAMPIAQTDWLAEDKAVDLFVTGHELGALRAQVKQLLGDASVDAVVQGTGNRQKKLLLCDMDSTMIQQECIDELAAHVGIKDKVADITARAMRGELEFDSALKERVALLQGLSESALEQVWRERITLMPGGDVLLKTMKAHGAYAALVSGGFTFFTGKVAGQLGFDEHHSNQLEIVSGALSGEVIPPILGAEAKLQQLQRLAQEKNIAADDAMAVGDGANDLPMLQAAGLGVALHGKPKVQEGAHAAINHCDLSALLYVQGYRHPGEGRDLMKHASDYSHSK